MFFINWLPVQIIEWFSIVQSFFVFFLSCFDIIKKTATNKGLLHSYMKTDWNPVEVCTDLSMVHFICCEAFCDCLWDHCLLTSASTDAPSDAGDWNRSRFICFYEKPITQMLYGSPKEAKLRHLHHASIQSLEFNLGV